MPEKQDGSELHWNYISATRQVTIVLLAAAVLASVATGAAVSRVL